MKTLLLILLFLPGVLFGTTQSGDKLILEGEEVEMYGAPLEAYFKQAPPRPPWLTEMNTACYRGYIATWEIVADELFLKAVFRDPASNPMRKAARGQIFRKLFPKTKAPLKATWFSGTLSVPRGKILSYVGFTEVREKTQFLDFEKGRLLRIRLIDNRRRSPAQKKDKGIP